MVFSWNFDPFSTFTYNEATFMFQTGTFGGFLVGQETWLRTFFLLWGLLSMAGVKPKMAHF